jgi:uncharacterized protein involved in exopolysaccharide biosynthesis
MTMPQTKEPARHIDDTEPSLLEILTLLLAHWRILVAVPIVSAGVAAATSLVLPPYYTATTSFLPESRSEGSSVPVGVAGLAAQIGIGGLSEGSDSPEFYAQVLESRTLRDALLEEGVTVQGSDGVQTTASVLDLLQIEGDSDTERLERGRRELEGMISVSADRDTRIVFTKVESRNAALSAEIANRIVQLLGAFNLTNRQSQSRARRVFAEERVGEAENELIQTEDALQIFLEGNRDFGNSPELQVQYERLQRQVTIKQEVLVSLLRQYEESRIEEVNDTPVITVIDEAVPPAERSRPHRRTMVLAGGVLGGMLIVVIIFVRSYVERSKKNRDPAYREYLAQRSKTRRELKRLFFMKGDSEDGS